jgi:hypothetical protein
LNKLYVFQKRDPKFMAKVKRTKWREQSEENKVKRTKWREQSED